MELATHYTSSKGEQKAIADMHFPYLLNALAKLERDHPERAEEIEAMRAEVAKRESEHEEPVQ